MFKYTTMFKWQFSLIFFEMYLVMFKLQFNLALANFFLASFFLSADYLLIILTNKTSFHLFVLPKQLNFCQTIIFYQTNNYNSRLLIKFMSYIILNLTKIFFYYYKLVISFIFMLIPSIRQISYYGINRQYAVFQQLNFIQ